MADEEQTQLAAAGDLVSETAQDSPQEAIEANPVLAVPDQVATPQRTLEQKFDLEDKLALALIDLVPVYWDAAHPSADLFTRAKEAIEAYQDSVK